MAPIKYSEKNRDIFITTPTIERVSLYSLPFKVMLKCSDHGWGLWEHSRGKEPDSLLAGGESQHGRKIEIGDKVISDTLRQQEGDLDDIKKLRDYLQAEKIAKYQRRVSFGDLVSDRWDNAREYGFGEGTSCYDNVLIIGDVRVGKHTWIGPNVILDGSGGGLEIGDHCSISAGVQIYTHDTVQRSVSMGQAPTEATPTSIGSGVYIGPNSIIARGVIVGDRAVIGAMSFVNSHVPSEARAWGCPARVVG